MENEIKIFENEDFGQIRTVIIEGQPWFVGKDVANALGYSQFDKAIIRHVDEDDRTKHTVIDSIGREQQTYIINESGLYSLILSSKLETAKKFKHWVTSEILPVIRKTGTYSIQQKPDSYTIEDPAARARRWAEEYEERKALEEENTKLLKNNQQLEDENRSQYEVISQLQPKADYTDTILACPDTVTVTQIAKDYGMTAAELNNLLSEYRIQYKQSDQWQLYAQYARNGYTQSMTHWYETGYGKTNAKLYTKWTQKGRLFVYNILKSHGILPMIERE